MTATRPTPKAAHALALEAEKHIAAATRALHELAESLSESEQWALFRDVGRVEESHSLASNRMAALVRRIAEGA